MKLLQNNNRLMIFRTILDYGTTNEETKLTPQQLGEYENNYELTDDQLTHTISFCL